MRSRMAGQHEMGVRQAPVAAQGGSLGKAGALGADACLRYIGGSQLGVGRPGW